jgi:tetratricopeptide (TPR) repeat protein
VFHRAAVAELLPTGDRAKLDERLLTLVHRDFIEPRRSPLKTEAAFRFRHILLRDAVYEAMAKESRATLHEVYADWLESRAGENEIIGYHLEQAYEHRIAVRQVGEGETELALRAAERLGSAGRAALKRGDIISAVNLLSRASSLPPPDASLRLQLLPDFGEALSSIGELARAGDVLGEAAERAKAAGDLHAGWRARLQQAWLRFQADPNVDVAEVLSVANEAVTAFTRLRDDRALAHAWHLIAWIHMDYGRLSALADAVRRRREHAQAAGDAMTEEDLTVWALLAGITGRVPAGRLRSEAEDELERARTSGSRRVEGAALLVLANCAAFEESFDEARELLSQATAIDEEIGGRGSGFRYTPAGMIELLAGDEARAEQELRTGYETLRERGDAWFLCGVAAELADVLWLQGRDDEAYELTLLSEKLVGEDVLVAQMMWRGARAKVLARRGRADEAEALAREGVAIIERTDHILYQADAWTDLAEVLRLLSRKQEAATAAEKARRLYESKGNAAAARRLQTMLDELRRPAGAGR